MALHKEIWSADVAEALYESSELTSDGIYAINADANVLNGRVVHIANASTASEVEEVEGNTDADWADKTPLTVQNRGDKEATYALSIFRPKKAIAVDSIDEVELSYSRRESIMQGEMAHLKEVVTKSMCHKWTKDVGTANIIAATGETSTYLRGAKKITPQDILLAAAKLTNMNFPKEGRFLLLEPMQMYFLMQHNDIKNVFTVIADYAKGIFPMYAGFALIEKPSTVFLSADGKPIAPATATATSKQAAIFWQKTAVEKAVGEIAIFDNPGSAIFQADLLSFRVRAGGRARYLDAKGIGLITG